MSQKISLTKENMRRFIFEGDSEKLSMVLRLHACLDKAEETIAAFDEFLFELLLFAINVNNVEAVRLLLDAGVNPNERWVNGSNVVPLIVASKCGQFFPIYEKIDTIAADSVASIVQLLLDHGADPFPSSRSTGFDGCKNNSQAASCSKGFSLFYEISSLTLNIPDRVNVNPLFHLHHLAVNSPKAATLILSAVPETAYDDNCLCEVTGRQTPLSICLLRASRNYGCFEDILAVFKHAILALLRCGARLDLGSLFPANLLAPIARLNWTRSLQIWGRRNVVGLLLVEANNNPDCVKSLLKNSKTIACVENNVDFHYLSRLRKFFKFLYSQYPRSLQAMCRQVILQQLPRGGQRNQAISQLDLPKSLIDYLNFKDFHIPK